MKLRILIFSCLTAILALSEQTHADIVTFQLNTISDVNFGETGVTSFDIPDSGLTLSLANPQSSSGFIDGGDGTTRGLTFDLQQSGSDDMWAVDISFDKDVTVIGYNIGPASNSTFTFAFGTVTGQSSADGDHVLTTPVDLLSGQAMTIAESSLDGPGGGVAFMATITVSFIPEPSSFLVLSMGGLALAYRRKRR